MRLFRAWLLGLRDTTNAYLRLLYRNRYRIMDFYWYEDRRSTRFFDVVTDNEAHNVDPEDRDFYYAGRFTLMTFHRNMDGDNYDAYVFPLIELADFLHVTVNEVVEAATGNLTVFRRWLATWPSVDGEAPGVTLAARVVRFQVTDDELVVYVSPAP